MDVPPAELLSAGKSAYLLIPVPQNRDFTERAVTFLSKSGASDVSKKDISRILSRLDVVALSVSAGEKNPDWELSATGSFPTTLSKLVLTEKNGWKKHQFDSMQYYEGELAGLSLSMMNGSAACASSKNESLEDLLSRWILAQQNAEKDENQLEWDISSFLEAEENAGDIRFFVPSAGDFMEAFIGVPLGVNSVRGTLRQIEGVEEFDSILELELFNPFVAIALSAVARRMGLSVSLSDDGFYVVSGLRVGWEQILSAVSQ